MDPVSVGVDVGVVGDGDFGEYFLVALPECAESLKRWPVVVAVLG
ncbi:hypothetical protein MB901379_02735 [Mycobacterium basiliense]|uniref:Uncharacterized protein n=1 Tax=Mycobacterium basiliense TaxID=2094119 RepID=A0A3S4BIU6_9MYCO|nr:hypothetical protein MB901379_02735 [Mycobacterium basiliense]